MDDIAVAALRQSVEVAVEGAAPVVLVGDGSAAEEQAGKMAAALVGIVDIVVSGLWIVGDDGFDQLDQAGFIGVEICAEFALAFATRRRSRSRPVRRTRS
ncbi:hypothetical protein ACQ86N_19375 [Puia sp. P3]|uniref:hypothetical protein n=1 Tax=Puia sp. P3 TaxID=3423952 RepID=UPI003D669E80